MLSSIEDLSRAFRNRLTPASVETGMHYLLRTLARTGPARVTELAGEAHLDASTVSRHVQNLERHGYVGRTQDPMDGRAYRLELSPFGRDLLDGLHRDHVEVLQGLIGSWSTHEVDELTG
jgi:DNA-binding MarR family transcriptional regulator